MNAALRSLDREKRDVICVCIGFRYSLQDENVVQKLRDDIAEFHEYGRRIKIALLDIDLTFPGRGYLESHSS
jgi:hypothetical protein